jgi:hypothetical protein
MTLTRLHLICAAIAAFSLFGISAIIAKEALEPGPSIYCYRVQDEFGEWKESYTPLVPGDLGVYWKRDDAWGAVQSPKNIEVDRDCLRRRGVPIETLDQSGYEADEESGQ